MDISVVLPVVNERENLRVLLPRLNAILEHEKLSYEILVIDGNSTDGTRELAAALGARVMPERIRGYSGALMTGLSEGRGDYVLTLDADLSHDPDFVTRMWRARTHGDIVIASRYVHGGAAYSGFVRRKLSDFLNFALRRTLSIPVGDLSSGFRLYRREAIENLETESRNFEIQEELLARAYIRGFSITEVPFVYFPRGAGRSHARVLSFGIDLARSALKLRTLRNAPDAADYEDRAFYSFNPGRRYRARRRHRIVLSWARGCERILAVGCGSDVVVQTLNHAIAMDSSFAKLRFLRRSGVPRAQASALALPFKSGSFDCVIASGVIAHAPGGDAIFAEMRRVLRPGGTLIAAGHSQLADVLKRHGFAVEETASAAGNRPGEKMILRCRRGELAKSVEVNDSGGTVAAG